MKLSQWLAIITAAIGLFAAGMRAGIRHSDCKFEHGKAVGRMEVIRELKEELGRGEIPEVLR
jgi:coenzyme F420-reducing hydrogenase delta subunit